MAIKSIALLLLPAAFILLPVACGDTQPADTPTQLPLATTFSEATALRANPTSVVTRHMVDRALFPRRERGHAPSSAPGGDHAQRFRQHRWVRAKGSNGLYSGSTG